MSRAESARIVQVASLAVIVVLPSAAAEDTRFGARPNGSLIAEAIAAQSFDSAEPSGSLFRIAPPKPRSFQRHDLIQIIVREASSATSSHELETEKTNEINGTIDAWPHLDLADILELQLRAGSTPEDELPAVDIALGKKFEGEGDYSREDEFSARLTAEVIEVMPNGNLILEARTTIVNDEEESTIAVTGICRPADVTSLNTVQSNQIHDLRIAKSNSGELKKANEKGIVTQVFDFLFAW